MGRNSRLLTTIGVAFSFLSWVSSLLSFLLPYWVYVDEKLIAPKIWRMSSTEMIQLRYNYGFWKYCSSMISSTVTSHVCGDIVTHQGKSFKPLLSIQIVLSWYICHFYIILSHDFKVTVYHRHKSYRALLLK